MSRAGTPRRLTAAARRAVSLAGRAARHAAWYVEYRIHGTPRQAPRKRDRR